MPQFEKSDTVFPSPSLEGKVFEPESHHELDEALHLAFDYRGDVTLVFRDGSQVEGYLYKFEGSTRTVHLFVKNGKASEAGIFPVDQIIKIVFSGEDTAFGKSWDDWVTKSEKQRKQEEEKLKQKASSEGYL